MLDPIRQRFIEGLKNLQLSLTDAQVNAMLGYMIELQKWNKTHNLTSITSLEEAISLHLLDSLAVLPVLDTYLGQAKERIQIADLGTGGGLPGIPLAIIRPQWQFYLMDAVQKKTIFLEQAVSKLKLENVKVISGRIEETSKQLQGKLTCCISRAFSDFGTYVKLAQPMLCEGGVLWAMKARALEDDLKTIPQDWGVGMEKELSVPGLQAERRIYRLDPIKS